MIDRAMNTLEDELDAIRLRLYEATRGMTPEEELLYFDRLTFPLMEQYHMRLSSLKPVKPMRRERLTE